MDPVSVRIVRASLLWLVFGFALGALMLSDTLVPGDWRRWFAPTHGHILFVGWFLQFAVGVGYWLLPRKRSSAAPLGYREPLAFGAFWLLNAGLLLRVIAEPFQRSGSDSSLTDWVLAASAILQFTAVTIVAYQLWQRILPRQRPASRTRQDAADE